MATRRLARLEAAAAMGAIPARVCARCGRPRRRAGPICLICARASPSGKRRERERKRRQRQQLPPSHPMTNPTPADAVRSAINALRSPRPWHVAAEGIRVAADALLPRHVFGDRSPQADQSRLLRLQFLKLANELAGNPAPAASREALAAAIEPTPEPITWCRSDDFAASATKQQSFSGWRQHHFDCDVALYASSVQITDSYSEVESDDRSQISDGYHTFAELYEHRHALMLALMRSEPELCWFSRYHADGQLPFGSSDWFITGAELTTGPITYHLPIRLWDFAASTGAEELPTGMAWDGHTPEDVVKRLKGWAAWLTASQKDALAARPLLEQVAAMADCIGAHTVSQITAISDRAAAWLRENPPGQPVSVEPRGCPAPGACSCVEPAQQATLAPARLRNCPTHGQQGPEAWGCPECVRELREELVTAREALRRLRQWGRLSGGSYSADVVLGVVDWIDEGMTAPLPPLPPYIASREATIESTPSAPVMPPSLVLDGGDGVRIEATNHERSSWAIRDGNWCLNSRGRWESEPYASSRDAGYLARVRWPSAEAAWTALLAYRAAEEVE